MKKFNFSLEKIKDIKETLFDKEKAELGRLQNIRNQMLERKAMLESERALKEKDFKEKILKGVRAEELRQFQYMKETIDDQIEATINDIAKQEALIEKQLEKVIEMDKEVKALVKLKEKQLEEYTFQENKEQQAFILELISNKISKEGIKSKQK